MGIKPAHVVIGRMTETNSTTGVAAGHFQWDSDEYQDANIGLRLVLKTSNIAATCMVEIIKVGTSPTVVKTSMSTSTSFEQLLEEFDLETAGNGLYEVRVYTTDSQYSVSLGLAELVLS